MKKQHKLNIKVRDLEPLKDVTGGRHRTHRFNLRLDREREIDPRDGRHMVQ